MRRRTNRSIDNSNIILYYEVRTRLELDGHIRQQRHRFGGGATGGGGGGGLDPEEIREIVVNAVEAIVGDSVLADQPLMEAGIDSLGSTELQQKLAEALSLELPPTLVFDYPTIDSMTDFISGQMAGGAGAAAADVLDMVPRSYVGPTGSVSIVASAGQEQVLQNWTHGDASTKVPVDRWAATRLRRPTCSPSLSARSRSPTRAPDTSSSQSTSTSPRWWPTSRGSRSKSLL